MTPEAYLLLSLPDASLTIGGGGGGYPETGVLNLECVSMPSPDSKNEHDKNVYLVLRVNSTEIPIDPARVVRRFDEPGRRVYSFSGTQIDPSEMVLAIATPSSKGELIDKIDAFDNILEQYVTEFHGPSHDSNTIAGQSTTVDIKQTDSKRDLRGQLVMVNEDTGEVVGQVEDRFRIEEDPVMHQPGHENDPVIIEVGEVYSTRQSDKDALTAFARIVPPEQRNWITSSANIASHAISMTTNLILTTITTASSFYISHSPPSPHTSGTSTPTGTRSTTPGAPGAPPPLPPRALVFLTSEKTKKNLNTIHGYSGEAVKISSKTVGMIDKMIRRAIGAGPKRQKYFPTRKDGAGQESGSALAAPGSALPARSRSPSPHPSPPPYPYSSEKQPMQQGEKPPLPPRNLGNTNAAAGPSSSQPPPLRPRLTTKDHLLISADLILSTIDDSTRRLLDTGTEQVGRIVGHKYGPERQRMSHPYGHHQSRRGQRRTRSPDNGPPTTPESSVADNSVLITTSPSSNRTIKKGKLGDHNPVLPPPDQHHTQTTLLQPTKDTTHEDPPPTPTHTTTTPAIQAQALLELLSSQLADVLHTVETLIQHPEIAYLDVTSTKEVLSALKRHLHKGAPLGQQSPRQPTQDKAIDDATHTTKQTHKKTYADATNSNPRGIAKLPPDRTSTQMKRTPTYSRFIVDFDGAIPGPPLLPQKFRAMRNQLNSSLFSKSPFKIVGIEYCNPKFKNRIALSFSPPITYENLFAIHDPVKGRSLSSILISEFRFCHQIPEGSRAYDFAGHIYPDIPWHRVVVENVPLFHNDEWADTRKGNIDLFMEDWEQFDPSARSIPSYCKRRARWLVDANLQGYEFVSTKTTASLCLPIESKKDMQRLLRDGVFVHGKHCRVSVYRPKARQTTAQAVLPT